MRWKSCGAVALVTLGLALAAGAGAGGGTAPAGSVATSPSASASMADVGVIDGGMFFSEEAVSEANDIVRVIRQSHERDVVVETFAAVPEDLKDELARDGRDRFYADWLERRAKQFGVRGVFVLITREPGRVQVGVDRLTRRRVFTAADGEDLRATVAGAFRARQFDRGLLEGLRLVRRRMDENTAADRNPTVPVVTASAVTASAGRAGRGIGK